MKENNINNRKNLKKQSPILMISISCILLIIGLCCLGIFNSKGTYSTGSCNFGSYAYSSGNYIFVDISPTGDGYTADSCCSYYSYQTCSSGACCYQLASSISNGYRYYNGYGYDCASGWSSSGSYCYNCNSGYYLSGSSCVSSSSSSGSSSSNSSSSGDSSSGSTSSSSCGFGSAYSSGNYIFVNISPTGDYTASGCCSAYDYQTCTNGNCCYQLATQLSSGNGYYYLNDNGYDCVTGWEPVGNYCYNCNNGYTLSGSTCVADSTSSDTITLSFMTMNSSGKYYQYTSMSDEKNTYGWVKFDMPVATSLGNPTLSGYTFNGWTKIEGACSDPISPSDTFFKTASSYTLYACFTKDGTSTDTDNSNDSFYNNYVKILSFYTMNSSGEYYRYATANCTVDVNKVSLLTGGKGYCLMTMPVSWLGNPTLSGYTFTGWTKVQGVCYDPISPSDTTYLANSSHSLYACFTKNNTTSSSCNFANAASISNNVVYMKLSPTGYTNQQCCSAYGFGNNQTNGTSYCTQNIKSDDSNKYNYYTSYSSKYCVDGYTYDSSNSRCYKCYDNYGLDSGGNCVAASEATGVYIEKNSTISYDNSVDDSTTGGNNSSNDNYDNNNNNDYNNDNNGDYQNPDVITNPQTGSLAVFICLIVAFVAISYSIWYFKKIKKINRE